MTKFADSHQPVAYLGHIKDQRLCGHGAWVGVFVWLNRLRIIVRHERAEKGRNHHVESHHKSPLAVEKSPRSWRDNMISGAP